MDSKIQELNDKLALAHLGGGKDRIANNTRRRNDQKRVNYLMDDGSLKK
jgi:propionyl-CoA carboxylase beta chain